MSRIEPQEEYTPREALEEYPDLKSKFHWHEQMFGILINSKVLPNGYWCAGKKTWLVPRSDIMRVIRFINEGLDGMKINLSLIFCVCLTAYIEY